MIFVLVKRWICTIWYRPHHRERNGSIWERCGLPPM